MLRFFAMGFLYHLYFALLLLVCSTAARVIPEVEVTVPELLAGSNGKMTLRFTALGRDIALHLVPDDAFLGPRMQIKHVGRDGGTQTSMDGLRTCFYSSMEPLAAVSLCKGVQGAFMHGSDSYVIQPRKGFRGQEKLGQHLVFKAQNRNTSWHVKSPEPTEDINNQDWAKYDLNTKDTKRNNPTFAQKGSEIGSAQNLEENSDIWAIHDISNSDVKGEAVHPFRHRRFVSEDRFVEILLVADNTMVQFYGDDLELHLLTLMSVAARIYKHPSLRNSVTLVVVMVILVEDGGSGPDVSDNGGLTLRNFCKWQQNFNPSSDRNPEHYDTAILLTRQDICGHESCDTLGVADIGTVCDTSKSCSVIEDNGLQAAYTLAHELGHVLSIPHDNSKNCEKYFGELGRHYLMAPRLQLNKTVPWSECSAMHLTEFFDSGHGDCLLDAPSKSMELPDGLPGTSAQYDLDSQCRQVFGKEFSHCPKTLQKDICSQLWCRIQEKNECFTKNESLLWADGTPCGVKHMCWDGVCLTEDIVVRPKVPVDGNWGSWGPWGECSRTCGGGVRFSYRDCNDPVPQNGGKYCKGQRAMYESCNIQECPVNELSFREEQCMKYNSYNFTDEEGNLLQWIPKYSGVSYRDRCKLVCQARDRNEFKVFQSKVVDGTLCEPESLKVCVQGQCISAGCDHILGSSKKPDKCGVCGGDGSSCRKITDSFNKSKYGYTDIVSIPAGATNIDIKERSQRGGIYDGNYLAIKKSDGSYLLNGDFAVTYMEQDLHLRGIVLKYSGSLTTLERIRSFYPLPESLTIQLLSVLPDTLPPKVKYSFFIPKNLSYAKTKAKLSHHSLRPLLTSQWTLGDWSPCSKSCGFGWQRRTVECQDVEGGSSDQCPQELRPIDIQPCGDLPCPIWRVGGWSPCSQSCGEGLRSQRIFCMDYTGRETEEEKCDPGKRPTKSVSSCILEEC
ncbi:A disintegrin and metalloproteinase with thrombospondin motifs 8 isoform X1 [Xenopus laevis]|uniref:Peptidase M12B domain-containing protein n=3 Tax=Xenopus laevis TaxID=8355 RepID=A0A974HBY1_XENLA|nr:A disintegrin and metalloproteinase with thrombospondin motifs 8 isoform X1 [Xenopus laevis]OCT72275.1 hypothetical protein XELAEV_18035250mg [Xenopus laevis]